MSAEAFSFTVCICLIFGAAVSLLTAPLDSDMDYSADGIIIGTTITSDSLFSSSERCIVDINGTRTITHDDGCLYNEGDKVNIAVSKLGKMKIVGLAEDEN